MFLRVFTQKGGFLLSQWVEAKAPGSRGAGGYEGLHCYRRIYLAFDLKNSLKQKKHR